MPELTSDGRRLDIARTHADHNIAEYLLHRTRTAAGTRAVADVDGLLLFAGGSGYPGPFTNGALRRGVRLDAAATLDRAEEFFGAIRRPFLVWIRDHADGDLAGECARRGYRLREPAQGLAGVATWTTPAHDSLAVPAGFTARMVADPAERADYLEIVADVYEMHGAPLEVLESVFFSLDSLRLPEMPACVVYEGDRAVAASSFFVTDGPGGIRSAGIQWAATRPDSAGHGLGALATAHAWHAAAELGASIFVAQSSLKGTPVWERMGFEVVTRYRRFYSPPEVGR